MSAHGIDWIALGDALLQIERLNKDDSGLLEFGLEQRGGIFVEQGRVCWVAASGLGRRLRDRQRAGEIPLREYAGHAEALKESFALLGLPLDRWQE